MKPILSTLILLLFPLLARAQNLDACQLLATSDIHNLFAERALPKAPPMGGYCYYPADDNKCSFTLNATAYSSNHEAENILKSNFDAYSATIAAGGKALGFYSKILPFRQGGSNAFFIFGQGGVVVDADILRLQFVYENVLVTFDVNGVDQDKVFDHLPDVYKIISGNLNRMK